MPMNDNILYWYLFVIITQIIFASIYYYFNKDKQDTFLLFFLGVLIYVIIQIFNEVDLSLWAGIWLFAILSILSFRKTFSTKMIAYVFIAIAFGLIEWFHLNGDIIIAWFILFTIALFEIFFLQKQNIKFEISIKYEDIENLGHLEIKEYIAREYPFIDLNKLRIKKVELIGKKLEIKWIL